MEFCLDGFMELQTFHVVIQFLDVSSWEVAIDEEYASLLKNEMPLAQHHKFNISWLGNRDHAKFIPS
jgi:hypothetical protein